MISVTALTLTLQTNIFQNTCVTSNRVDFLRGVFILCGNTVRLNHNHLSTSLKNCTFTIF